MSTPDIVRLDFHVTPQGVVLAKFKRCQSVYMPTERTIKTEFDLENSIAWCLANGWTVRRWPNGARAWKGAAVPIRDQQAAERTQRDFPLPAVEAEPGELPAEYDYRYDG